jgi:hypothetical protein
MDGSFKSLMLTVATLCPLALGVAGCSSVQPTAYSGLASSSYLHHDQTDKAGRVPYSYSTQTNWHKYTKIIVDPVEIYQGNDNQFGDMSAADRTTLANYAGDTFAEKLRARFELAKQPEPNTLRVKLTLTGATTTTPVLGPFSRFDIAGGIYNVVQTTRGREGAFTGSVMYAVEIYDASTKQLLNAYVTKQYPNPYNLGASFGALSASKTGIDKGADALVAQLK